MINGEIVPIIEAIDYTSKDELLQKLRAMRDSTVRLAPDDRRIVKQMLGIAIQEVCLLPSASFCVTRAIRNSSGARKRRRKWKTKKSRPS